MDIKAVNSGLTAKGLLSAGKAPETEHADDYRIKDGLSSVGKLDATTEELQRLKEYKSHLTAADSLKTKIINEIENTPRGGIINGDSLKSIDTKSAAEALVRRLNSLKGQELEESDTFPGDSKLIIYFRVMNLPSILEKGFLNQHQTGTSGAIVNQEERLKTEKKLIDLNLNEFDQPSLNTILPKYAFAYSDDCDNCTFPSNYGDSVAVFKDSVLPRTTWTETDSLGNGYEARTLLNKEDREAFAGRMKEDIGFLEAQIWGQLNNDDIRELWLDPRVPDFFINNLASMDLPFSVYAWEQPDKTSQSSKRVRGRLLIPSKDQTT